MHLDHQHGHCLVINDLYGFFNDLYGFLMICMVSEVQKVEEMRRIGHLHLLAVTKLLKLNKSAEWFPEKKNPCNLI